MNKLFPLLHCRKLLLCIILLQGSTLTVSSQQHYWQQEVNFRIDVTLNDEEHSLDGFERITYINHSPDSLLFIWFHIWPNAFKNDQTAFSEQLLRNGRTDFYFADKHQRGYINRLDFKIDGSTARMEDHPEHTDIIKLILPGALPPGDSIDISTAFHVQLPENFSRGGHKGQSYQITQWYPKPAVYDKNGWHPMPYLDQGEFYSDFGNYDVSITVPANYMVAATGVLQNSTEKEWLKERANHHAVRETDTKETKANSKDIFPLSATGVKTVSYLQNNVHDFAWFADKRYVVDHDTLALSSGRVIDVYSFYLPSATTWKNSIQYLKDAVKSRSAWIGEYPFDVISAVEAEMGVEGGMEYPTITSIFPLPTEKENEFIIGHEVGHNWFQGILASNERAFPWMDEGMNSYYDNRYAEAKAAAHHKKENFLSKREPASFDQLAFETLAAMKKDQPISTASSLFSNVNYGVVSYYKAAHWMKQLESKLGVALFDSCMKTYYKRWQFKHPYPEDFKAVVEEVSGRNLDDHFASLQQKGSLQQSTKKQLKLTGYFNLKDTDKYQYFSIAPAAGFNWYDGIQLGALLHNYQLPLPKFQFIATPLYGTKSGKLNGLARVSYNWYPDTRLSKIEAGLAFSSFNMDEFKSEAGSKILSRFTKFAPFARFDFKEAPLSSMNKFIQFRSYLLSEDELQFEQRITGTDTSDFVYTKKENTILNEVNLAVTDDRILYPYDAQLGFQQHKDFLRASFTGNYFFNYSSNKGGIKLRWYAGKFIYLGSDNTTKRYETDRYHLNLSGARGYEDYTYSNYFIGRNEFEGIASQQMMIRDGGFKVSTDLLDAKAGKTDDWLAALNFTIHVPNLSDRLPVKLFFDIGTYAEAWQKDMEGSRFLYDAGLQVGLFRELIKIYVPIMYSGVYKDYFRSTLGDQRFLKTISFSIDIRQHKINKLNRELVF